MIKVAVVFAPSGTPGIPDIMKVYHFMGELSLEATQLCSMVFDEMPVMSKDRFGFTHMPLTVLPAATTSAMIVHLFEKGR